MANSYGNPLVLDTVWAAGSTPAALKPPTGSSDTTNTRNSPIQATRIEWFNPLATTDTAIITDINGNVIITAKCETANVSQILWQDSRHPLKLKMNGWALTTLGSGKIIIYY